jgi:hypothetical protein
VVILLRGRAARRVINVSAVLFVFIWLCVFIYILKFYRISY